ncbi:MULTISPECIES: hypothetical protein [Anaerotignum]|uniref:hypothetical protein n=1 Tax=Anaerotignum TaxID=2039240 RepID=UPI00210AABB4|nr:MULTISPECIES: hypothetical protein [Anaerotignum]MCQ4935790.1 hypothetical protein [Anaerotignum propionicum]
MNENNSASELENNVSAGDLAVSTNMESATNIQTKVSEKTKKSKLLLVSGILGTLYLIYLITYFMGGMATDDQAQVIAGGIATMLVMPHMLCVGIAVIFTWIGWALRARWGALVAGILYSVSILAMFIYAPFVIIQLILSFVGFAKMKKSNEAK